MAIPGFYNDNLNRAYPFINTTNTDIPDSAICDFGCIIGGDAEFNPAADRVYLHRIRRLDTTIEIEFKTTADVLEDRVLRFNLTTAAKFGDTFRSTAVLITNNSEIDCTSACIDDCSNSNSSTPLGCNDSVLWYGFLVIGRLPELLTVLTDCADFTCTNSENVEVTGTICEKLFDLDVEPSLIQSLSKNYIQSISVANAERTRATVASECAEFCWPFPLQEHYIQCECVFGDIAFEEGYNTCIDVDPVNNVITINACPGGGVGYPCEDVKLLEEEAPPTDRTTLDGALRCDEVVSSINGVSKRFFEILGGPGVIITPKPELNKIIVDVSLDSLALCADLRDRSSISPAIEEYSSCECGPA